MNENQEKQNNLINTTDCLEAVGVFRCWKNFLFVIAILCLLLLQITFWLVDTGCVKIADEAKSSAPVIAAEENTGQIGEAAKQALPVAAKIKEAAKQAAAEPNQPAEAVSKKPSQPQQKKIGLGFLRNFEHWSLLIRLANFVLVLVAILYCLTMLFTLKVSLLGRLGGINHISRAFFLSLLFLVLLLPWQRFFAGVVAGAMFTPKELLTSYAADDSGIFGAALYYLRFTGYWLLVMLLLIFAQFRSVRWAKAILRRLEVI